MWTLLTVGRISILHFCDARHMQLSSTAVCPSELQVKPFYSCPPSSRDTMNCWKCNCLPDLTTICRSKAPHSLQWAAAQMISPRCKSVLIKEWCRHDKDSGTWIEEIFSDILWEFLSQILITACSKARLLWIEVLVSLEQIEWQNSWWSSCSGDQAQQTSKEFCLFENECVFVAVAHCKKCWVVN